ncbi:MAG: hypothetical protein ACHQ49_14555 [Elusimicrobiota bacterium]
MKAMILSLALLGAASAASAALTPEERSFSLTLSADPPPSQPANMAPRARYVATREYVHRADAVINRGADPLSLGVRPPNNDTRYYQGSEAKMVSDARDLSNIALMNGIRIRQSP